MHACVCFDGIHQMVDFHSLFYRTFVRRVTAKIFSVKSDRSFATSSISIASALTSTRLMSKLTW